MKLKELLERLGIHLDECTSNEQLGEYELVIEEYNEPYDKWNLIELDIRIINDVNKQIIFK
jgi:hypothetical protein